MKKIFNKISTLLFWVVVLFSLFFYTPSAFALDLSVENSNIKLDIVSYDSANPFIVTYDLNDNIISSNSSNELSSVFIWWPENEDYIYVLYEETSWNNWMHVYNWNTWLIILTQFTWTSILRYSNSTDLDKLNVEILASNGSWVYWYWVKDNTYTINGSDNTNYLDPFTWFNVWWAFSVVPPIGPVFNFTTSWYSFFENWFALNNFVPDPYGWLLQFEVIAPSWSGSVTLLSDTFWPYETDWNWYWFDSIVTVTTFLHEEAWVYQVRPTYSYWWITVFPFGEDYNEYTITLPETTVDFDLEEYLDTQTCWWDSADSGFLPWVSTFFSCATELVSSFFGTIWDFISWITDFFSALSQFWNTNEFKNLHEAFNIFSIPWANAATLPWWQEDVMAIVSQWSFENIPLLNNLYNLVRTVIVLIFIIWALYYLIPHKDEHSN